MPRLAKKRVYVMLIGSVMLTATLVLAGVLSAGASDHDEVRAYWRSGEIIPLAQLLARDDLVDLRVIEAELEEEDGVLVYELEVLGSDGRVRERYYDASSGEPIGAWRDD